jgi:hypothetical protein
MQIGLSANSFKRIVRCNNSILATSIPMSRDFWCIAQKTAFISGLPDKNISASNMPT